MELGAAAKGQQAAPSGTLVDRLDVLETQMLKVSIQRFPPPVQPQGCVRALI